MKLFWAFFYGWLLRSLFSRPTSTLGWVRVGILCLIALLFLDTGRYLVYPDVSALAKKNPRMTKMMRLRVEQAAEKGKKLNIDQRWVGFSNISPYAVKAVLIGEDDKFWSHEGFDFEAMGEALEKDIEKRQFRFGGSTISQQLAKNLYLSPSKNPVRKLKEAILTWRIEHALSKRRILEIYLNVAEWGDGIFGIDAAARHYYGIPASGLGPEQAARLAAVLPNPRKYSPVGTSRYVANRSRIIYNIMLKRGIVIPEYNEAMQPDGGPGEEADTTPQTLEGEAQTGETQPVQKNYTSGRRVTVFTGQTTGM
jgi:monofunctional glycosyltransferase